MQMWPGHPYPLGATYDGAGTNFSLFSEVADGVELCLFDDAGNEKRIELTECEGFVWHAYLPTVGPGQQYGYRVRGPWEPQRGKRCNRSKLLLDPYAKAVEGVIEWSDALFGHQPDAPNEINTQDNAPVVPKAVVTSPYFEWGNDRHPRTPLHRTIIYELHVRGFTYLNERIPPELRGTYAGLGHRAAIDYLKALGITAVELQPVHQFVHDHRLVDKSLRNYWGYNSIAFFAPHSEYRSSDSAGTQVQEFKQMVSALHAANIEVILDVVYNHTAEGNYLGPILSLKGIDNEAYYRLDPNDPSRYVDYTGTGNSLNARHPHVLQLIMDSLRYWVNDMHVDGFRFDLASTLAREFHDVDRLSAFFDIIQQDPVISQVKLIAEPWDVGEGGYQVGNFPPVWSEWNGKYRDTVRDYWRGEDQTLGEFASRITGSSDLYEKNGRRPMASVNFVTAHDGFTLNDLVSYNVKHNEANLEDNRDGESFNRSWNCGTEGPTDHTMVNALRRRQRRNFLATLLLSQGVPMLLAGDELGRTQLGNNNAYCQDNNISWIDWSDIDADLLAFTRWLANLRRDHPVFRRRGWFQGRSVLGTTDRDIGWYRPDGHLMTDADWEEPFARVIGAFLDGNMIPGSDAHGGKIHDDSFFVIFSSFDGSIDFMIPHTPSPTDAWVKLMDTYDDGRPKPRQYVGGAEIAVRPRSVVLLRHVDNGDS